MTCSVKPGQRTNTALPAPTRSILLRFPSTAWNARPKASTAAAYRAIERVGAHLVRLDGRKQDAARAAEDEGDGHESESSGTHGSPGPVAGRCVVRRRGGRRRARLRGRRTAVDGAPLHH